MVSNELRRKKRKIKLERKENKKKITKENKR